MMLFLFTALCIVAGAIALLYGAGIDMVCAAWMAVLLLLFAACHSNRCEEPSHSGS